LTLLFSFQWKRKVKDYFSEMSVFSVNIKGMMIVGNNLAVAFPFSVTKITVATGVALQINNDPHLRSLILLLDRFPRTFPLSNLLKTRNSDRSINFKPLHIKTS